MLAKKQRSGGQQPWQQSKLGHDELYHNKVGTLSDRGSGSESEDSDDNDNFALFVLVFQPP